MIRRILKRWLRCIDEQDLKNAFHYIGHASDRGDMEYKLIIHLFSKHGVKK